MLLSGLLGLSFDLGLDSLRKCHAATCGFLTGLEALRIKELPVSNASLTILPKVSVSAIVVYFGFRLTKLCGIHSSPNSTVPPVGEWPVASKGTTPPSGPRNTRSRKCLHK